MEKENKEVLTGVWNATNCQLVLDVSNPSDIVGEWIERDQNFNISGNLKGDEIILERNSLDNQTKRKMKGKLRSNQVQMDLSYESLTPNDNSYLPTITFVREGESLSKKRDTPVGRISFCAQTLWQSHNMRYKHKESLDSIMRDLNCISKRFRKKDDKINRLTNELRASQKTGQDLQMMIRRLIKINESLHEANRIGNSVPQYLDDQSENIKEKDTQILKPAPGGDRDMATLQQELEATKNLLTQVRKENRMYRNFISKSSESVEKEENILEKLIFTLLQDFGNTTTSCRQENDPTQVYEMSPTSADACANLESPSVPDISSPTSVDFNCGQTVRQNIIQNIKEVNQLGDVMAQTVVQQTSGEITQSSDNVLSAFDKNRLGETIHKQKGEIEELKHIVNVLEQKLISQKDVYEEKIADNKKEIETFKSSFQSLLLSYQTVCKQVTELDRRRQLLLKEAKDSENQKLKLRWKQMFQATLELQAEQYENEICSLTKKLADQSEHFHEGESTKRRYESLIREAEKLKLPESPLSARSFRASLKDKSSLSLPEAGIDDFRYSWSAEPQDKKKDMIEFEIERPVLRKVLLPSSDIRSRTNIASTEDDEDQDKTKTTLEGMLSRAQDVLSQLDALTDNLSEQEVRV